MMVKMTREKTIKNRNTVRITLLVDGMEVNLEPKVSTQREIVDPICLRKEEIGCSNQHFYRHWPLCGL